MRYLLSGINRGSGLHNRRLGGASGRIPLEARLCIRDIQLYKERRLYGEYIAIVGAYLHHFIFLHKFQSITDVVRIQRNLIKGIRIHEMEQISVCVQILHILAVNTRRRKLLRRTESLLNHTAVDNILKLCTDKRCISRILALTRSTCIFPIYLILNPLIFQLFFAPAMLYPSLLARFILANRESSQQIGNHYPSHCSQRQEMNRIKHIEKIFGLPSPCPIVEMDGKKGQGSDKLDTAV